MLAPEHPDEVRRVGMPDALGDGVDARVRVQPQAARLGPACVDDSLRCA
jgi:hypothetical protein